MKKFIVLIGIALLMTFSSCDSFFSTPIFEGMRREYNPDNIDINVNNVKDWEKQALGNKNLSNAVIKSILNNLENSTEAFSLNHAALINTAVKLAVDASGIGQTILGNAASAVEQMWNLAEEDSGDVEMLEAALDLFDILLSDFDASFADKIAETAFFAIDQESIDDSSKTPEFLPGFEPSPDEVGMAILVLALGIVDDMDFIFDTIDGDEFDLGTITDGLISIDENGDIDIDNNKGNQETVLKAQVLAAYLNLIATAEDDEQKPKYKDNFYTGFIYDAFKGNN